MTIQDAYEWARHNHWPERASILDNKTCVADLDCTSVTRLSVSHSYAGELPDLNLFPKLESFSCTSAITMEYLSRQDLSKIKELYISFNYGEGEIFLSAPRLEKLNIAIRNNESNQLNMFSCNDNSIRLKNMPRLQSLSFRFCTGHRIIIDEIFPSVERVSFINQDWTDYSILRYFPRLSALTISGCSCDNIAFLEEYKTLKELDLSYNYIRDITPLTTLPLLEYVNLRKTLVEDANTLKSDECTVVVTPEDYQMERFKEDVQRSIIIAYDFIDQCRVPNPARPEAETRFFDHMSNDEIFVWKFKKEINRQIKTYSSHNPNYPRTPIATDILVSYIHREYPFVCSLNV